jgi:hypothetical protein
MLDEFNIQVAAASLPLLKTWDPNVHSRGKRLHQGFVPCLPKKKVSHLDKRFAKAIPLLVQ